MTLASAPTPEQQTGLVEAFEKQTGFQLKLAAPQPALQNPKASGANPEIIEIPTNRIRLNSYQQSLSLDPLKLEKAVERARLLGINPPIQVRRTRDGYILSDGLYRLRAAETLGLERIPALVE